MERRAFLIALAGTGVGLALPSFVTNAVARSNVDFRTADLMTGGFALRSSQLALDRSRSYEVRDFANAEIAEQVQVSEMLAAAPGGAPLRREHAVALSRLEAMPESAEFDRSYVQGQLQGHRELLRLNADYLRRGRDERFRSVANMSLPIIQRHLAILQNLHEVG